MKATLQFRQSGLTLVELMATLAVLIVLLTIGAPAFTDLMTTTRVTSTTNNILAHLQYARSEAVKRGNRVAVGPFAGEATWKDGQSWEGGFMVAVVADAGITISKVLRRVDGTELQPLTIQKNGSIPRFFFHADGTAGGAGTLTIRNPVNPQFQRSVVVDPIGRARGGGPLGYCDPPPGPRTVDRARPSVAQDGVPCSPPGKSLRYGLLYNQVCCVISRIALDKAAGKP
jgi:type IV fimbrial biogenesis protein FimT